MSQLADIDLVSDQEVDEPVDKPGNSAASHSSIKRSHIWEYYTITKDDPKFAQCQNCPEKISRGGIGKTATNTSMINHLKRKHNDQYEVYLSQKNAECIPQPPKRQLTMESALNMSKKWKIDDPRAITIHNILAEMIPLDNEPISIVEREGFRRYSQALQKHYQVPGRKFFTTKIIPTIFERCRDKIRKFFEGADFISFTTDIWTEKYSNQAFISLTAHWISAQFQYLHCVLNSSHFPGSHTGDAIGQKILLLFNDWKIDIKRRHLTMRDNAANMASGLNRAQIDNEPCFIHTLQLCIGYAIKSQRTVSDMITVSRNIVTHFHHSAVATVRLSEKQKQLNVAQHKFVQDFSTRWNSTYYMLNRILEQREVISYFAGDSSIISLSENQWNLLSSMLSLLQPFEEITKLASASHSIISEVIPDVATLIRYLSKDNEKHHGVGTMKSELKKSVEKRFAGVFNNQNYCCATFLDPRFKQNFFKPESTINTKAFIIASILTESNNLHESSASSNSNIETLSKSNPETNQEFSQEVHSDFWKCYSELATENQSTTEEPPVEDQVKIRIEKEITDYVLKPVIGRKESPFIWWEKNIVDFSYLTKLVRKYLSAPSSTVFSERLFSTKGNVYEDARNRLLPVHGEMLTFLNRNLRLLEKTNIVQ